MPFPNFVEKLKEFPVGNSAVNTTTDVYSAVKSSHCVVQTTLNKAEAALFGLAEKFKDPIGHIDSTMVKGLEKLEETIPIVRDQPAQIMEKTMEFVTPTLENISSMASSGGSSLKEKANYALKTPAGRCAMETLDVTSAMTDKAIDYAFPPREGEEQLHPHSNSYCEDKVYHVVHTVGTLGIKAGRKVCSAVSHCVHSNTQATAHAQSTAHDTSTPQAPNEPTNTQQTTDSRKTQ